MAAYMAFADTVQAIEIFDLKRKVKELQSQVVGLRSDVKHYRKELVKAKEEHQDSLIKIVDNLGDVQEMTEGLPQKHRRIDAKLDEVVRKICDESSEMLHTIDELSGSSGEESGNNQ